MQTSFKIDDRVELTERYSGHNPGDQGTIYKVEGTHNGLDGGQMLYVKMDDGGQIPGGFSKRFKAVEVEGHLKVGDRVGLIEDYNKIAFKGEQGTITRAQYKGILGDLVGVKFDNGYDGGSYVRRLKLVDVKAHEYKVGDRVQVTIPEGNEDTYGGRFFVTGPGTVKAVEVDCVKVLADIKHPSRTHSEWWVDRKFVTPLVEAPFQVGDLVEILDNNGWCDPSRQPGQRHKVAMVDETEVHLDTLGDNDLYYYKFSQVLKVVEVRKPELGDVIISKREWGLRVAVGTRCIVTRIGSEGSINARVQGSTDTFPWFFDKGQYELVPLVPLVEKPKATPATDTKPRVGDTIVSFWNDGGVETRKKGVIASFDPDGTACTAEGEYITYDTDGDEAEAGSVFIVERGPEPVVDVKPVVVVNPLDETPVGSKATDGNGLSYIKTGKDEWKLILSTHLGAERTSLTLFTQFSADSGFGLTVTAP